MCINVNIRSLCLAATCCNLTKFKAFCRPFLFLPKGSSRVGASKGSLSKPHIAPLPLYEPYVGLRNRYQVTTHLEASLHSRIPVLHGCQVWGLSSSVFLNLVLWLRPRTELHDTSKNGTIWLNPNTLWMPQGSAPHVASTSPDP